MKCRSGQGPCWEDVSGGEPAHTRHSWALRNLLMVIQLVSDRHVKVYLFGLFH